MMTDSIVQEVRAARAAIAADFGYDLSKYLVWIREQTRLRKEAISQPRPSKTLEPTSAASLSPVTRKRRVHPAAVSV
jgi:hypothetical protein